MRACRCRRGRSAMAMPDGYVKAKLAIEGGETIQALFNPTEFTITKGNNWTFDPIKGTSLPKGKFGGGKPREMQVNLLLDQSLPNAGMSVKDITDKLFKMMDVPSRSEEHTSELQSQSNLVCRLLLEKKKQKKYYNQ